MKKLKIIWYLLAIIPIILLILGYVFPSTFFSSQEQIRNFIEPFGIWAPVIFILIQIIQVILTPISTSVVSIAGGFIFGTWQGFLYNWIGRVIGTLIAFWLGRRFGRKIIRKFVNMEKLKKYDSFVEKGKFILFLMYFLPFFPDDELSYLAGFSSMKAKTFVIIALLGHLSGSLA
ncbi:MAG: VTT domain-containing protein, partial [Nanoarchaeota archaeon]|nr:VTT domain-containing protein [Nanoarchaeota archaeon]